MCLYLNRQLGTCRSKAHSHVAHLEHRGEVVRILAAHKASGVTSDHVVQGYEQVLPVLDGGMACVPGNVSCSSFLFAGIAKN